MSIIAELEKEVERLKKNNLELKNQLGMARCAMHKSEIKATFYEKKFSDLADKYAEVLANYGVAEDEWGD